MKEMKWESIAESLNCTTNEAKKRWDCLRNQFSRKLRAQKIQPSGSGQTSEWPLMSYMSFLKPHIQNRKTRGSLLQIASSRCSETSSSCSINSSIPQSPTDVITSHCQFPASYTYSARFSDWNDDCNASLTVENLNTSTEDTAQSESSGVFTTEKENIGSTLQTSTSHISTPQTSKKSNYQEGVPKSAKRILVPPLDNFAKKKKASNERLEDLLNKSSQAISDLATTYKDKEIKEKEGFSDANTIVISQALKTVMPENQLSCLIAVLQLIEKFKE
ncbi:uncharacterized protein LOC105258808 [Camponotus floridanus]|uniref:uncharacterized protein LOC105258808 n=1 Tax=Camponotus floridanus TaxID=104421 RepID=UPI000DC66F44|nr:uncharacterized protein LOC105258808 [Camponotus floridanus]